MIVYSLLLFYLTFTNDLLHYEHPILLGMLTGLSLLIAPLHYLYAKYLVTDIIKFDQKDTIHFIYYVAYLVILTIYIILGQTGKIDYSETELPIRFVIFNWLLVIQCPHQKGICFTTTSVDTSDVVGSSDCVAVSTELDPYPTTKDRPIPCRFRRCPGWERSRFVVEDK